MHFGEPPQRVRLNLIAQNLQHLYNQSELLRELRPSASALIHNAFTRFQKGLTLQVPVSLLYDCLRLFVKVDL
jgi:hypothetical protein